MDNTTMTAGQTLTIVIRPESIEHHNNKTTTGIIFWKIGGICFPDGEWNDFIVVIATWWLKAIGRLLRKSTTFEILRFMDGPYTVVCSVEANQVECQMVDNRKSPPIIEAIWKGKTIDLAMSALNAAEEVLRRCEELQTHNNTDIDELKEEMSNVKNAI